MKTFIVMSDSHGKGSAVRKLSPIFGENDYIVHLGDGVSDMRETLAAYPQKTYSLRGNCDFSAAQEECVLQAEGVKIFCCHGHRYGVKQDLTRLTARAQELGCTVALYGHTHRAAIDTVNGILCINPGAIGDYSEPSYCYLVAHGGKATATIVPLP